MVLILAALIIVAAPTNKAFAAGESDYENFVSAVYEDEYFKLFSDAAAADILIDSNDFPSVIRAVDDLQDDIYKVTDARPAVKTRDSRLTSHVIIVGSVDKSKFIKQLAERGKLMFPVSREMGIVFDQNGGQPSSRCRTSSGNRRKR